MNRIIIIILTIVINAGAFTQPDYSTKSKKAIALFEEAQASYNLMEYDKAIRLLNEALAKDEKFIEVYLLQAQIYNENKEFEEEIKRYHKVIEINPDYSPKVYLLQGQSYLRIGKYEEAKHLFEKFISFPDLDEQLKVTAQRMLKCADFGVWAIANPKPFALVNLGENINSPLNEYWTSLTADEQTMIITILIPRTGVNPDSPVSDKTFQEDLYVSHFENNEWTKVYNIGPEINTEQFNEGTQAFSVDGKYLFYTVCNKPGDFGRCDIYYSMKVGEKWLIPENIGPPVSTKAWESHPCFSSDGKTLYFASNRAGSRGEMDIWTSTLQSNGNWSEPVNIGDSINTKGFEMSPFIHPDNQTLYFASDGHIGLGGMDIYYSRRTADGTWSSPVNLGYPINTWHDEKGLIVNARGVLAYFASNRFSNQKDDIFSFELYREARPCIVTYVKGKIYDRNTNKGLDAKIELSDLESRQIVVEANSDKENGKYLVCLPTEREYAFNIFKRGYMFHSENFSLKNLDNPSEPYYMDFPLVPIRENEIIVLKNIFFETDSYELKPESEVELNKLVGFLDENMNIHIEIRGHTDSTGTKEHNELLSLNRAKSVYDYLLTHNIEQSRLSYNGYGFSIPVASNETPEGRAKNRRTEFKIIKL
ncbi:MAG: PD40 domain-containing protein [Bacteroidia bacterium]|nr:PD40 domain-containing protein [Bacteroidia bacterium]